MIIAHFSFQSEINAYNEDQSLELEDLAQPSRYLFNSLYPAVVRMKDEAQGEATDIGLGDIKWGLLEQVSENTWRLRGEIPGEDSVLVILAEVQPQ